MRYGENPHQTAAFYLDRKVPETSIASTKQLHGKELSFNNIVDADTAIECIKQFNKKPACAIIKHSNPCGVALGKSLFEAYDKAYSSDPESAFGGIIAFNNQLDLKTIKTIIKRQFVEIIIAPTISLKALKVLSTKPNIRFLQYGQLDYNDPNIKESQFDYKRVNGGLLVQETNSSLYNSLKVMSIRQPTKEEMHALLFSWKVAKFVKSNAIIYVKNDMTIGIGAGQMSRINSARIAIIKAEQANHKVQGSVMASDGFLPFSDSVEEAVKAGITAIIQPGGSIRDQEIILTANKYNIAMLFTGIRHFRH